MIGKVIQEKRKEAGLTQAQLAERLGVTAPAVNRWEKDLSYPDASLLAPLARSLKTDLNSLFSFYDALSEKERRLITERLSSLLMEGNDDAALEYIEGELRQNPADGMLYKMTADMLVGFRVARKASDPAIYLEKICGYYERALELLPEKSEDVSYSLITVYSEMGLREKAEEAWSRIGERKYDKEMAHAEMLCTLKDYGNGVREIKEVVLQKVKSLSFCLGFLRDALRLNGEYDLAEVADKTGNDLRKLFDMAESFDHLSRICNDIAISDADAQAEHLSDFLNCIAKGEKISGSPLFADIVPGGAIKDNTALTDCIPDIVKGFLNR